MILLLSVDDLLLNGASGNTGKVDILSALEGLPLQVERLELTNLRDIRMAAVLKELTMRLDLLPSLCAHLCSRRNDDLLLLQANCSTINVYRQCSKDCRGSHFNH